jgi:hypothetical protein
MFKHKNVSMKKLLLIAVLMLLFTSCEGPVGPPGYDGKDGVDGVKGWRIEWITVRSNQWGLVNGVNRNNSYYVSFVDLNYLTDEVYEDGFVIAYRVTYDDEGHEVQTPLTQAKPYAKGNELWTEIYSYDFMPGSLAFYMHYDDFNTSVPPPDNEFRVVIIW